MSGAQGSQPMRAAAFLDSLGVVTHLGVAPYDDAARIDAMLDYIGIRNIRQNAPIDPQSALDLAELGRLGAKIDFLINGNGPVSLPNTMADIAGFLPWLNAVELPNEVDLFPIGYAGLTGITAVMRFQQDVYAALRADRAYDGLDVYGFSVGGTPLSWFPELRDMSPHADYANVHGYSPNGNNPGRDMPNSVRGWRQIAPSDPVVVTETGYYTSPGHTGWGGVTENVQAQYILDTAFGNASRGVARTYFYDLINDGPDINERENNFGLFRFDGSAKPVANALHNLTTILADTGPSAATFGTEAVAYSVSGLSTYGGSLLLEKSDGAHVLAVWNEADLWNEVTGTEIAAPRRDVRINLDRAYGSVLVFDPMLGTAPVAAYADASSIVVSLAAHPVLLQFDGVATRTAASVTGVDTLVLRASEDAYQGDAQFTVRVDGVQLGGVHTVTALRAQGQVQDFAFTGQFGGAGSRVTVEFLNDAFTPGQGDRNLIVEQVLLNGQLVPDSARFLYGPGPAEFYLPFAPRTPAAIPAAPPVVAPGFVPPPAVIQLPPAILPPTGSTPAVPGAPVAPIPVLPAVPAPAVAQAAMLAAIGRGDGHFDLAPDAAGIRGFTFTDASGAARRVELGSAPRVNFADGWVEFSGAEEGAAVARLYRGILGRDADAAGLAVQVSAFGQVGAVGVAAAMLASPEGRVVANGPIHSYVAQLYRQQLGRAPEEGAAEYWEAQLAAGTSRAVMAAAIATSAEAGLDHLGLTRRGLVVSHLEALEVGEAYVGVLGRRADAAGLAFWTEHREAGATKAGIARALSGSAEFRDTFGGLDDLAFIRALYHNALGREAEPGAPEAYAALLREGASRADLAAAFQESPEAVDATLRLAHTGLDLL